MRIKIKSIFIGVRHRRDYGGDKLQELAADLKENGQITPITVRPISSYDKENPDYNGETFALVAGGRRVVAAALLGWEDIEGYEREEMKELTHRILELHENIFRKPMDWKEEIVSKAEIMRLRLIENPDIKQWQVAKELGIDAGNFSQDLKAAQAIEENPALKKAGSKRAALQASKELKAHAKRTEVQKAATEKATAAGKPTAVDAAGPLEDRVRTADAVEYTKGLEAASIDLALLDGPYGYNFWKLGHKVKGGSEAHLSRYDDSPEAAGVLYEELLPELVRVIRETGWLVMFTGTETYIYIRQLMENLCRVHRCYRKGPEYYACQHKERREACDFYIPEPFPWIWYRKNTRQQPRFPTLHAKNMAELIFACNMGKAQIVQSPMPSVLEFDQEYGERVHANQKPMDLYKEIITRLTFTGDVVLDTFFGSGNSLAAAAQVGRIPKGCDSNPEMLPFALGRIRQYGRPITQIEIDASHERFRKRLLDPRSTMEQLREATLGPSEPKSNEPQPAEATA